LLEDWDTLEAVEKSPEKRLRCEFHILNYLLTHALDHLSLPDEKTNGLFSMAGFSLPEVPERTTQNTKACIRIDTVTRLLKVTRPDRIRLVDYRRRLGTAWMLTCSKSCGELVPWIERNLTHLPSEILDDLKNDFGDLEAPTKPRVLGDRPLSPTLPVDFANAIDISVLRNFVSSPLAVGSSFSVKQVTQQATQVEVTMSLKFQRSPRRGPSPLGLR
jgi:hypothetical protein